MHSILILLPCVFSCRWLLRQRFQLLQLPEPNAEHNPLTLSQWHADKPQLRRRLLVTLLTVTFFHYPSLLTATLSLFTCYRLDVSAPTSAIQYPEHLRVGFRSAVHCWFLPSVSIELPVMICWCTSAASHSTHISLAYQATSAAPSDLQLHLYWRDFLYVVFCFQCLPMMSRRISQSSTQRKGCHLH